jgi:hypothetical protein
MVEAKRIKLDRDTGTKYSKRKKEFLELSRTRSSNTEPSNAQPSEEECKYYTVYNRKCDRTGQSKEKCRTCFLQGYKCVPQDEPADKKQPKEDKYYGC